MAEETPNESLTNRERYVGWFRFLVFLIGLLMSCQSAAHVHKRWEPVDANPFLYAISSFLHCLWPRLLLGIAIGAVFLALAMLFKQRPPWLDAE